MTKSDFNTDSSLGYMVDVEVHLGSEGGSLSLSMLNETHSTEFDQTFDRIRIELRL